MVKTLEDSPYWVDTRRDSLEIAVARQALESEASKQYLGQVIRHRLNKTYNEVPIDTFARSILRRGLLWGQPRACVRHFSSISRTSLLRSLVSVGMSFEAI